MYRIEPGSSNLNSGMCPMRVEWVYIMNEPSTPRVQGRPTAAKAPVRRETAPAPVAPAQPEAAATAAPTGAWDFHRWLTVIGLGLAMLVPLAFFGPSVYGFIGPMLAPTVIALGLILWKARPWTYLTVAILGALFPLFVLVMLGLLEGQLFNPVEKLGFGATLSIAGSLLILEAGAIPGYVAARAGRPGIAWKTGLARPQGIFAVAVVALLVGAIGTSFVAADQAAGFASGGYDFVPDASTGVTMKDFAFNPQDVAIDAGVMTEIVAENQDNDLHTFTYVKDGVEYNHDVLGGSTAKFLVLFDEPGTYDYWCAPHSGGADDDGSGMVGTITVA